MRKTLAIVIAMLIMVTLLPAAMAAGKGKGTPPTASEKAARHAVQQDLKAAKATMQANHRELMKLRIQVRTTLEEIEALLAPYAVPGATIPAGLDLTGVATQMQTILTDLKATGNHGQLIKGMNAALKAAGKKDFAARLAAVNDVIAKQGVLKTALQNLVTQVTTLKATIAAAIAAPSTPAP
jgi:hypothetical protein